ncbi:hypothetical protein GUJ93_ZPchr0007g5112 [Zizania palustris]|uniref:Uncharacterized protein n=1 Tax=Zizania palustris TaxID=103762 RepID=A0A8J5W6I1_ZIZPA|nr:hypothetical protein GUJ93_ZPchr0007g5112 [Zizania palustris]
MRPAPGPLSPSSQVDRMIPITGEIPPPRTRERSYPSHRRLGPTNSGPTRQRRVVLPWPGSRGGPPPERPPPPFPPHLSLSLSRWPAKGEEFGSAPLPRHPAADHPARRAAATEMFQL